MPQRAGGDVGSHQIDQSHPPTPARDWSAAGAVPEFGPQCHRTPRSHPGGTETRAPSPRNHRAIRKWVRSSSAIHEVYRDGSVKSTGSGV